MSMPTGDVGAFKASGLDPFWTLLTLSSAVQKTALFACGAGRAGCVVVVVTERLSSHRRSCASADSVLSHPLDRYVDFPVEVSPAAETHRSCLRRAMTLGFAS